MEGIKAATGWQAGSYTGRAGGGFNLINILFHIFFLCRKL